MAKVRSGRYATLAILATICVTTKSVCDAFHVSQQALFDRIGTSFVRPPIVGNSVTTGTNIPNGVLHAADSDNNALACERRDFLSRGAALSSLFIFPAIAVGEEGDLTSRLYNPDGTLKDDIESEAKFRTIERWWDVSDDRIMIVDGEGGALASDKPIRISYDLTEKWGTGDQLYVDNSSTGDTKKRACNRITIYQAPGKVKKGLLEKAATAGVGKSLDVPTDMNSVRSGDLVGGRKRKREDQTYYDFDVAVAPAKCGDSDNNLGLGFCPYDAVFLMSATVVSEKLYVIVVESDSAQWKFANSDLKNVRSSFTVDHLVGDNA